MIAEKSLSLTMPEKYYSFDRSFDLSVCQSVSVHMFTRVCGGCLFVCHSVSVHVCVCGGCVCLSVI